MKDELKKTILDALNQASGALTVMGEQMGQMSGLFDDADGAIAAADRDGADALKRIQEAAEAINAAEVARIISPAMRVVALLSPQGTACYETALYGWEDTPDQRTKVEWWHCNGAPDGPVKGTWTDVSDNDAFGSVAADLRTVESAVGELSYIRETGNVQDSIRNNPDLAGEAREAIDRLLPKLDSQTATRSDTKPALLTALKRMVAYYDPDGSEAAMDWPTGAPVADALRVIAEAEDKMPAGSNAEPDMMQHLRRYISGDDGELEVDVFLRYVADRILDDLDGKPASSDEPRVKMVCGTCSSEDVKADAWAIWNVATQEWEVAEETNMAVCEDCDGETTLVVAPAD